MSDFALRETLDAPCHAKSVAAAIDSLTSSCIEWPHGDGSGRLLFVNDISLSR